MDKTYDVKTTFFRLAFRVPGVLYEPVDGPETDTIILVMHSDEDYLTFVGGEELAKRGYKVLCANPELKEGIVHSTPEKLLDVANIMRTLKGWGYEKIILAGHSGGATLLSAYQVIAENGISCLNGDKYIYPISKTRGMDVEYPKAAGIMLLDANWGNAVMTLFSLDPAVVTEGDGNHVDSRLDLFNPDNGFEPEGSSYPDNFIRRFQKAQGDRYNRLINTALARLELIESGKGNYLDDEPFLITGGAQGFLNNKLFAQDVRLFSKTRKPHLLLHPDGSISEEIVKCVRGPENPETFTSDFREGACIQTVRSFLSTCAVRTGEDYGFDADSVYGIDWDSTYASAISNVPKISVPILVMGMTAGWEFAAAETIYDRAASEDKTLAYVEGATHLIRPAEHLESFPGQFGNTIATTFDYVAKWLAPRF